MFLKLSRINNWIKNILGFTFGGGIFFLALYLAALNSPTYAVTNYTTNLCPWESGCATCNVSQTTSSCGGGSTYGCNTTSNGGTCWAQIAGNNYRIRVYGSKTNAGDPNNQSQWAHCESGDGTDCTQLRDINKSENINYWIGQGYCRIQFDVIDGSGGVLDHLVWRDPSRCQQKYSCNNNACVVDSNGGFSDMSSCLNSGCSQAKYTCNSSYACVADPNGAYSDITSCQNNCQQPAYCGPRVAAANPANGSSGNLTNTTFNWSWQSGFSPANCSAGQQNINVYLWDSAGRGYWAGYPGGVGNGGLPSLTTTSVPFDTFVCFQNCSGAPTHLVLQPGSTYSWRIVPCSIVDNGVANCTFSTSSCSLSGSISGTTTPYVGCSYNYTASGSDSCNQLSQVGVFGDLQNGDGSWPGSWTAITNPFTNGICSGSSCTKSFFPQSIGQYRIMTNAYSSRGSTGTGNVCTGDPAWNNSSPYGNCGASDSLTVTANALPAPTAWHCNSCTNPSEHPTRTNYACSATGYTSFTETSTAACSCPVCYGPAPSGADWVTPLNGSIPAKTTSVTYNTGSDGPAVDWTASGSLITSTACSTSSSCDTTISAANSTNYGSTSLTLTTAPGSSPLCSTKPICVVQKPDPPANGSATTISYTGATVRWDQRSFTGTAPAAYYTLDDNVFDTSGNGRNGTNNNGSWMAAKKANGLSLNGSSSWADLGSWFNYQSFTISMWIKPGASQAQYADILDNNHGGSSDATYHSLVLQQNSTATNQYQFYTLPGSLRSGYGPLNINLSANSWQYLTITRNSSGSMGGYVNGNLVSTANGGVLNYDGSQYFRLGRWGGGGRYWSGVMDDVKVYNYVRSSAQILEDYNDVETNRRGCVYDATCSSCQYNYLVEWGTTSGSYIANSGWQNNSGAWNNEITSYSASGLSCGTTYYWRVRRGTGYTGVESASPEYSFTTTACPPACTGPGNATDFVTPVNSSDPRFTIPAKTIGPLNFTNAANVTWTPTISSPAALTSTCPVGKNCSVTISAANTTNYGSTAFTLPTSPVSSPVCSTTNVCVVQKPFAPANLTTTNVTKVAAVINWSFYTTTGTAPVAYWKMDESSGQVVVDSVGTNTGTAVGTTTTAGQYGNARSFNGTNDYVSIPDSSNWYFGNGDFTIEGWIYPSALQNYGAIWQQGEDSTSQNTNDLEITSGKLRWLIRGNSGTVLDISTGQNLITNSWQYVSAVRSGSVFTIYVNGQLSVSGSSNSTIPDLSYLLNIGRRFNPAGSYYYKGLLDDFKVYNYARSSAQILEDMGPVGKRGCAYDATCSSCSYDYLVEWGLSSGNYNQNSGWLVASPWNSERTSYNMSGLMCGTTYYYRVRRGTGYSGVESWSAESSFTTSACTRPTATIVYADTVSRVKVVNPSTAPGTPVNFTAVATASGGSAIQTVTVDAGLVGGSFGLCWGPTCTFATSTVNTLWGVTTGTYGNYYVKVGAINASSELCTGDPNVLVSTGTRCSATGQDYLTLVVCPSKGGSIPDPTADQTNVLGTRTTKGEVLSANTDWCTSNSSTCKVVTTGLSSLTASIPWPEPYYACMAGKAKLQIATNAGFTAPINFDFYRISPADPSLTPPTGPNLSGTLTAGTGGDPYRTYQYNFTFPGFTPVPDTIYYWRVVRYTATSDGDNNNGQASAARQFVVASKVNVDGYVYDSTGLSCGSGSVLVPAGTHVVLSDGINTYTTTTNASGYFLFSNIVLTNQAQIIVTEIPTCQTTLVPESGGSVSVFSQQAGDAWPQVVGGDLYFGSSGLSMTAPINKSLLDKPAAGTCGIAVTGSPTSFDPSPGTRSGSTCGSDWHVESSTRDWSAYLNKVATACAGGCTLGGKTIVVGGTVSDTGSQNKIYLFGGGLTFNNTGSLTAAGALCGGNLTLANGFGGSPTLKVLTDPAIFVDNFSPALQDVGVSHVTWREVQ